MARRKKSIPSRRPAGGDPSVLIRSAESLGRMIGRLQRQLDQAVGRLDSIGGPRTTPVEGNGNGASPKRESAKAGPKRTSAKAGAKTGAKKKPARPKR